MCSDICSGRRDGSRMARARRPRRCVAARAFDPGCTRATTTPHARSPGATRVALEPHGLDVAWILVQRPVRGLQSLRDRTQPPRGPAADGDAVELVDRDDAAARAGEEDLV